MYTTVTTTESDTFYSPKIECKSLDQYIVNDIITSIFDLKLIKQ